MQYHHSTVVGIASLADIAAQVHSTAHDDIEPRVPRELVFCSDVSWHQVM